MERHPQALENPFGCDAEEDKDDDNRESVLDDAKKSKNKRKKKRNKKKKNRGDVTVGHSTEPEEANAPEGGFKLQRQGPSKELQLDKSKIQKLLEEHAQ